MSGNLPFGFQPPDPDDSGESGGGQPGGMGGFDMSQLGAMFSQLGSMLQHSKDSGSGPVNWDLATDLARKSIVEGKDPSVSEAEKAWVRESTRLAELWLDPVTQFPASSSHAEAWSRSEWLEETLPGWKEVIAPIAEKVSGAMSNLMPGQGGLPGLDSDQIREALDGMGSIPGMPEGLQLPDGFDKEIAEQLSQFMAPLMGMAQQMGSMVFGMQVGQALAALATEVLGSADVGVPLAPNSSPALVPRNVAALGEGLEIPEEDLRIYLALPECAHQRLFAHTPWLQFRVRSAIQAYAQGIGLDQDKISSAMQGVDPSNPESITEALGSGVFIQEDTPEQKQALAQLETLLALIEGWVDAVVEEAIDGRLSSAPQLREVIRRRRAAGGPGEKTFANLIGLELRPRRLRESAELWETLTRERGVAGRDAMWSHPDLLPTAEDLGNPSGFVAKSALDEASEGGEDSVSAQLEAVVAAAEQEARSAAANVGTGHLESDPTEDDVAEAAMEADAAGMGVDGPGDDQEPEAGSNIGPRDSTAEGSTAEESTGHDDDGPTDSREA